jgi:hypothetical protein
MNKFALLVKTVALRVSEERAAKCGYDLLMGFEKGDAEKRYQAWRRYLEEVRKNEPHTDAQRDDVWVPALNE